MDNNYLRKGDHTFLCMLHVCRYLQGQKCLTDPQELESQALVSCLIWMLGNELRSPGRAANSFLHWFPPILTCWHLRALQNSFELCHLNFQKHRLRSKLHIACLPSYGTAAFLNILPQHNDICQFHNSQYLWIFPSATLSTLHMILFSPSWIIPLPDIIYIFQQKIVNVWNLK